MKVTRLLSSWASATANTASGSPGLPTPCWSPFRRARCGGQGARWPSTTTVGIPGWPLSAGSAQAVDRPWPHKPPCCQPWSSSRLALWTTYRGSSRSSTCFASTACPGHFRTMECLGLHATRRRREDPGNHPAALCRNECGTTLARFSNSRSWKAGFWQAASSDRSVAGNLTSGRPTIDALTLTRRLRPRSSLTIAGEPSAGAAIWRTDDLAPRAAAPSF